MNLKNELNYSRYHKNYMGTRYVELFSLYEDHNRAKMIRNGSE